MCVVFCLGFYKKIQNPKHICVEEGPSFIFLFLSFFLLCFLSWLDFLLLREIDARTDDDDVNDAGVVVVVLRAHNAKTKGFPRREITHHTHALEEEEEEEEDFESTTLSGGGVFSLL